MSDGADLSAGGSRCGVNSGAGLEGSGSSVDLGESDRADSGAGFNNDRCDDLRLGWGGGNDG